MTNLEKCQEKIDRLDATYRAKYPNGFWGWVSDTKERLEVYKEENVPKHLKFITYVPPCKGCIAISDLDHTRSLNWNFHHPFPTDSTQPDPMPHELPSPLQELREATEKRLGAIARLEELDEEIEELDQATLDSIEVLDGLINERNDLWEGVK